MNHAPNAPLNALRRTFLDSVRRSFTFMRLVLLLFTVLGLISAAEIPQGTHLLVRMVNSVTTRTAREGDRLYMRTASPVIVNGQFVVPVDSYAEGTVSRSVRSGRVKGRAELGIRIESLTLPNGKTIHMSRMSPQLSSVDSAGTEQKVDRENEIKQGGTKEKDAKTVGVIAAEGAAIGGLAGRSWKGAGIGAGIGSAVGLATTLVTRGREVELPQGSTFDVVFDRAIAIE